jgi:hypothetical protein
MRFLFALSLFETALSDYELFVKAGLLCSPFLLWSHSVLRSDVRSNFGQHQTRVRGHRSSSEATAAALD